MRKGFVVVLVLLFVVACASSSKNSKNPASGLTNEKKQLIYEACVEIVVEKPIEDNLTYEKPLPWDSIPYNIRVDKYYSIGTAFAVSESEMITAFHVLNLHSASLNYKKMYIRDAKSQVYEISTITAFDSHRDFVKFTTKGKKFTQWFNINNNYEINDTVSTVGNAYGEGIVIRQGELIGTIAEEESNKFILLRSSSDVNPGNSGGPLLDRDSNVIGVVLRKKDNICYSLPFREITRHPAGMGIFHSPVKFGFNLLPNETELASFDLEIKLPKEYSDITSEYKKVYTAFYFKNMDEIFKKRSGSIFPEGETSLIPLNDYTDSFLLQIIHKDNDSKRWTISDLKYTETPIRNNGKIMSAKVFDHLFMLDITKPDDVPLKSLIENPVIGMGLVLEGINIPRTLGNEKIRITSLGNPLSISSHVDKYKRKWRICTWSLNYSDEVVISYSTPTPQGLAVVIVFCYTSEIDYWTYDLNKIVDFTMISYYGKIEEWKELLNYKNLLPQSLDDMALTYTKQKNLKIKTKRFAVDIDNSVISIMDDTILTMKFGFYQEKGTVIWDIRNMNLSENQKGNYFGLVKNLKPDNRLPEGYISYWNKMINFEHPYNDMVYSDNGKTLISAMHKKYSYLKNKKDPEPESTYLLYMGKEGKVDDAKMKKDFNRINNSITIID